MGLIAGTPFGQLLSLMDPFRGVTASALVGVVRGEMKIKSSHLEGGLPTKNPVRALEYVKRRGFRPSS